MWRVPLPKLNKQLFANSPALHVGEVTLLSTDDLQLHWEKLARIILDEMYQFVGLLGSANFLALRCSLQCPDRLFPAVKPNHPQGFIDSIAEARLAT
jgi:hypothetical protein